jgi:Transposase zinc-ribbon domain
MKAEPAFGVDRAEAAGPRDPQSTEDAISLFSDPDYSLRYLVFRRWPDGQVRCPHCGSANVAWLAARKMWECRNRHPQAQFSVRSGTFMEDSRISLGQWLTALWLIAERNRGVSSYEVARRIGVTQKSAWLMMKRIGKAFELSGLSPGQLAEKRLDDEA